MINFNVAGTALDPQHRGGARAWKERCTPVRSEDQVALAVALILLTVKHVTWAKRGTDWMYPPIRVRSQAGG